MNISDTQPQHNSAPKICAHCWLHVSIVHLDPRPGTEDDDHSEEKLELNRAQLSRAGAKHGIPRTRIGSAELSALRCFDGRLKMFRQHT